jgi:peroxiredoxin
LTALQSRVTPEIRILLDPGARVVQQYGLLHVNAGPGGETVARPATFVVGSGGRVTYAHVAEQLLDRPQAEEVLTALEAAARTRD